MCVRGWGEILNDFPGTEPTVVQRGQTQVLGSRGSC